MMETVASAVLLYMAVLAAVTAAALMLAGRQTVDLLEVQMPPTRLVEGGQRGRQSRRRRWRGW